MKMRARKQQPTEAAVGIFWVDVKRAKVYAEKTNLRDAMDYGAHRIHRRGHYDAWGKVSRRNPTWAGMEYEDVPRGRVVYRKDPRRPDFVVYAATVCNTKRLRAAIAKEFSLPPGFFEFDFTDEHYWLPGNTE